MTATLSTHVLDTGTGRPAAGVTVSLSRGDTVIATAVTDADGRIRELGGELVPGTYRLAFDVATPFFRRVTLDVDLRDGHQHVPLLLSAYGVASYRGS